MNILILDDHHLIIDGVKLLLSKQDWVNEIYDASTIADAISIVKQYPVDTVINDLNLSDKEDGRDFIKYVKVHHPKIKVIVLTMFNKKSITKSLQQLNVDGILLKDASTDVFLECFYTIQKGEVYYDKEVMMEFMMPTKKKSTVSRIYNDVELTNREKEIVSYIGQELTTKEIAANLFLSTHTIEVHRKNIMFKLGVKNVVGVIKYGIENGIIQ